jgi:serine/threonine protein kinase
MTRWRRASAERLSETVGSGWRLESIIGSGGTATVYRAHGSDGRKAAVKLMHGHLVGSWSRRFEREARLLAHLREPSIVELYEFGRRSDVPFLVLELLSGKSLDRVLLPTAVDARAALLASYAEQALNAVSVVHSRGILHRDLKPSNLFLTTDAALKVLDFGAATSEPSDVAKPDSLTSGLLGTPAFMAPEQALGRWDLVDERSDIWSLAATIFTLLTGEHVHPGRTRNEQLGRAMAASARPIRSLLPELEPALAGVLDRALSYRREDRYPSAAAFREALQRRSRAIDISSPKWAAESTLRERKPTERQRLAFRAPLMGAMTLALFVMADVRAAAEPSVEPGVASLRMRESGVAPPMSRADVGARLEPPPLASVNLTALTASPERHTNPLERSRKLAGHPVAGRRSLPSASSRAATPARVIDPLDVRLSADVAPPNSATRIAADAMASPPPDIERTALDVRN